MVLGLAAWLLSEGCEWPDGKRLRASLDERSSGGAFERGQLSGQVCRTAVVGSVVIDGERELDEDP